MYTNIGNISWLWVTIIDFLYHLKTTVKYVSQTKAPHRHYCTSAHSQVEGLVESVTPCQLLNVHPKVHVQLELMKIILLQIKLQPVCSVLLGCLYSVNDSVCTICPIASHQVDKLYREPEPLT